MSSKTPPRLQLGRCIDQGSLEFVEVLGVGGYGVVYRAVETHVPNPRSYAVKCLFHSKEQPPIRRQFHIREIALHQISSAHPGVVTLHRVIEDHDYTYIIMDYTPDQDLFTQILNHCRYLGNDALIKHVFLQLVDAVEYCHSLGIYHRDLKPENVLCFENGCRVAITDFGLATTEKMSVELHTGSIYHMSPECQGGVFAIDGSYSPMSNDVWSLGIILLNLATGRNPWRTATTDDLTFQAYLRDPPSFFPSVLPVSLEMNDILIQMLHVDWKQRMTLAELRQQMEDVTTFYAPDVVFEGSQARCAWEARIDVERIASSLGEEQSVIPPEELKSFWSDDSRSEIDLTDQAYITDRTPDLDASAVDTTANGLQLDRQGRWNSFHHSHSTSPPTPADRAFENGGLMELSMEDIYEKQQEQYLPTAVRLSTMDVEESFKGSTGRPFRLPRRSVLDTWIDEPEEQYSTAVESDTASSWAFSAASSSSLSSTDSVSSSEIRFAKADPPPLGKFAGAYSPSSGNSRRFDDPVFKSMKLFPRSSLFPSPAPKESPLQHYRTSGDIMPLQTRNLQPAPTALGLSQPAQAAPRPDVQKERESRWRISRFGSTRRWFSAAKFFTPSLAS